MPDKTTNQRIAEALLHIGSPDYVVRSGSILTLMSDLAKEGELGGIARAFEAYCLLVPKDRSGVSDAVPAKVLNGYIHIHRRRSTIAVEKWRERTPEWADRIKDALVDPDRFERLVKQMGDDAVSE